MITTSDTLASCRVDVLQVLVVLFALLLCGVHSYFLHSKLDAVTHHLSQCGCRPV